MDPQTFGKQSSYNAPLKCDPARFIYVPVRFDTPATAAAGDRVFSDVIDLTTFTQGAPSPFIHGIQSMIVIQRNSDPDVITADAFLSEFTFDNQFKCFAPGRAYTALTVLASQYPKIAISVFAQQAVASVTSVAVDIYFGNFAIDDLSINIPTF